MDKKDILEFFLERGILLKPEELDNINEENYMQFLENKLKENKENIIIETVKKGKITNEEFIKNLNKNFEFLNDLIVKKVDVVSINKAKKITSNLTISGRVKEKTPKGFILEDLTDEVEIIYEEKENDYIKIGDIFGVNGYFKGNIFFAKKIIWPDIPLEPKANHINMKITLTSKIKEDMSGFVICPHAKTSDRIIGGFRRIGKIKIVKDGSEFIILAFSPKNNKINEMDAVKILKRRMLPELLIDNLIKEVPDIFWLYNNGKNWFKNYKGVMIVSTNENSFVEINNEEINFGEIN
ncbi:MAG: hypothetical protein QW051_01970 [Candidatus Aenigmatarchaeota archaeon]